MKAVSREAQSINQNEAASRVLFRARKYNQEGVREDQDATSIPTKSDLSKAQSNKHAIIVLRTFDEREKYAYSQITIEDDGLRALLMYALAHRPDFSHVRTIVFDGSFEPIVHSWNLLNDLASNDKSKPAVAKLHRESMSINSTDALKLLKGTDTIKKAASDLRLLLEQVKDTPRLENYFSEIRGIQESASAIPFDFLWTIFPPGELVLSRKYMSRPQIFIVKRSTHHVDRQGRSNSRWWNFECWSYDWNGSTFTLVPVRFTFEEFKGTKSIGSLHCYPLKYHREDTEDGRAGVESCYQNIREV